MIALRRRLKGRSKKIEVRSKKLDNYIRRLVKMENEMAIKVRIPTPLRKLTDGKGEIDGAGKTVDELFINLENAYPGMKERLCDETGNIRRFLNVYVNEEDIRFKQGKDTVLTDGDEVSIVPAIAGGGK